MSMKIKSSLMILTKLHVIDQLDSIVNLYQSYLDENILFNRGNEALQFHRVS